MSSDDKRYQTLGYRVRHKYKYKSGQHPVCTLCGTKRRSTSSGYEYFDPRSQPTYAPPNHKKKHPAYWSMSNPPCVKYTTTGAENREPLIVEVPTVISRLEEMRANDGRARTAGVNHDGPFDIGYMSKEDAEKLQRDGLLRPTLKDPEPDLKELVKLFGKVVTDDAVYEAPGPGYNRVRVTLGTLLKFVTPLDSARDEASHKLGTLWIWTRSENEHLLMQASHVKHVHRVHAIFWSPVLASIVRGAIEGAKPQLAAYTMFREAGIIPPPQWSPK